MFVIYCHGMTNRHQDRYPNGVESIDNKSMHERLSLRGERVAYCYNYQVVRGGCKIVVMNGWNTGS